VLFGIVRKRVLRFTRKSAHGNKSIYSLGMTGKRDAAYYRARLRRDYPTFFVGLASGKYGSVREAAAAAGLIRLPSRLDALKREWKRANEPQRDQFRAWLKPTAIRGIAKPISDSDGRLRPNVRAFLSHWVESNKSKPGRIMKQIGFSGFDYRLSMAIYGGHELRPVVISKLTDWLVKEGFR